MLKPYGIGMLAQANSGPKRHFGREEKLSTETRAGEPTSYTHGRIVIHINPYVGTEYLGHFHDAITTRSQRDKARRYRSGSRRWSLSVSGKSAASNSCKTQLSWPWNRCTTRIESHAFVASSVTRKRVFLLLMIGLCAGPNGAKKEFAGKKQRPRPRPVAYISSIARRFQKVLAWCYRASTSFSVSTQPLCNAPDWPQRSLS